MGRDHFLDGTHCLSRSRPRRLRIGDLMVAVAITALGLTAVCLPELTGGERLFLGAFALAFLGLQCAQWGVASIPVTGARPGMTILLGVLSSLMALSMFIFLIILGLVFPQGAALLSVMMLILVVYLTTWD
jgi:hypothetical protein